MEKRVGIIGFGNMGSSIAERIKPEYAVYVFDKDKMKTKGLWGATVAKDIQDVTKNVEAVILAVKPQDFDAVLRELKALAKGKLVISIAAGISTKHIEKALGDVRVVRVMPNIGMKIGESVSCLSRGKFASDEDFDFAQELFYCLGTTKEIKEDLMNAATAISGSGPAYIFDFIESNAIDQNNIPVHARHDLMRRLESAALSLGFNLEEAAFLSANTVNASIDLLHKTKISPAELRKQVTSKGGTTEAALEVLHKGGNWEEAAQVALRRAEQLAKKE